MEEKTTEQKALKSISIIHKIYGWFTIIMTIIGTIAGSYFSFIVMKLVPANPFGDILGSFAIAAIAMILFGIYNIFVSRLVVEKNNAGIINSFIVCGAIFIFINSTIDIAIAVVLMLLWGSLIFRGEPKNINKKAIAIAIGVTLLPIAYSLYNYFNHQNFDTLTLSLNIGDYQTVEKLLKDEQYAEYTDRNGNNLLVYLLTDDDKMLQLLVDSGIDINHQDNNGNTALHHAVLDYRINSFRVLLKHGARTDIKNQNKKTALDLALDIKRSGGAGLGKGVLDRMIALLQAKQSQ